MSKPIKKSNKIQEKGIEVGKIMEIAMKLKEIFKEMKTKHKMEGEKTNTVLAIHIFVGDFQNHTCDTEGDKTEKTRFLAIFVGLKPFILVQMP